MYRFINSFFAITLLLIISSCNSSQDLPRGLAFSVQLKTTGNPYTTYSLKETEGSRYLKADTTLPVLINYFVENKDDNNLIKIKIKAKNDCNISLSGIYTPEGINMSTSEFLLPGFWYHNNSRSPENAPSYRQGRSWIVREDRLSSPLAATFDTISKIACLLMRNDIPEKDALMPYDYGEMVMFNSTDLGGIGFGENGLIFSYPFTEKPFTYRRKLWLAPETNAFIHLKSGESREISWEISSFKAASFSDFVEKSWSFAFSRLDPQPVPLKMVKDSVKHELSQYFRDSYTECGNMVSSSGVELRIDKCEQKAIFEIGFVGRVLMNAFNSLEYGYQTGDSSLVNIGQNIFNSYEKNGFSSAGVLREWINCNTGDESFIYSLRRQSEGLSAIIHFLDYEKKQGRLHPELEQKSLELLNRLSKMQREDNSFPRKFNSRYNVVDNSGGSTPTIIIPLLMASSYFHDTSFLQTAQKTALFLDREIVDKADYFSSTLDANCEDKEASLYTLNSYYYLWQSSTGNLRDHYLAQAKKVSFFALSWYYLWDVPFAPGQMLGDLGFKTRGWGNVSVENNHVDVYVFEFTEVLKWLATETGDQRYSRMAEVIASSMNDQLLPRKGYLCGIAKPGYHPEVVQHTNWDYGKNGKGFYNDIFAPGWVVCSLWELLTPGRTTELIHSGLGR